MFQSTTVGLTTLYDSASAGWRFSFESHSSSDSYMGSVPHQLEVRIIPNGAIATGSCSSAHVTWPPRSGAAATRRRRAADAGPATAPAAAAPAATWPLRFKRSLLVILSDTVLPSLLRRLTGSDRSAAPHPGRRRRRRIRAARAG